MYDIFADEEIPRGSLLSLILGNINLIELDEEVVQIMRSLKTHKGQRGFCRQRR
jgi:hypothetical protein